MRFSTHILTRKMTYFDIDNDILINFLTHILSRRMTTILLPGLLCMGFFNSHPLEEDDVEEDIRDYIPLEFSTHILTRRMTAILNKNTLYKTAYIILFEYNMFKIYVFLISIYFSFRIIHHFLVRISQKISVHLSFALQYQCVPNIKSRFCTNMFYLIFILIPKIIKPQTVNILIYNIF